MKDLRRALIEETGTRVKERSVRKYFFRVYSYLLYQDIAGLFEALDYRNSLGQEERKREHYFVFRYMLRLIKSKHPRQYTLLCPIPN